ncbi:YhcN/YlaJ family sporulation lipoprotein [Alkaliphilus peptidifermentans]|uniref:Sporulation lipoprotein, YhcN/YlaJ family n=1 Tax=Alkaliphilus peptidifermentans DSM 18978 TaxID=1120976 RepID=A0A1G5BG72_9FIRM|nr:YhcN/YlaJ family sporulation lipoprotein [Alkaliphilus peptidifermentans]SCX89195.1 sporulation lipoprotein, YhcN/YlaJ family [Alkaliphilus peptidifermentans DSM 18978]
MKSKKLLIFLCFILILGIAATGCRRPVERPAPAPADPRRVEPNQEMTDRNAPMNMQPGEAMQDLNIRADRIVNAVVKLEEVRSATVVITDNIALVGVSLTEDTQGEVNTEVKKKIEDVVRRTDRNIERVSVSADPDIVQRIENISTEATRGRPLSGFGREIEELIRRMTPGA